PVDFVDLRSAEERERAARVRAALEEEVQRAFSLEHGPLILIRLLQVADQEHLLIVTAHHIVCDGWSMAVMLQDLAVFYTARVTGGTAELPEAPAFSAYAREEREFERTPEYRKAESYWLQRFSGTLPTLELSLDAARPPSKS